MFSLVINTSFPKPLKLDRKEFKILIDERNVIRENNVSKSEEAKDDALKTTVRGRPLLERENESEAREAA